MRILKTNVSSLLVVEALRLFVYIPQRVYAFCVYLLLGFIVYFTRPKGTEIVISSDSPFKEWHVRFITLPFKLLFDKGFRGYSDL